MALLYNPLQVVFVSCRGRASVLGRMAEKEFIIATAWHSPVSENPPLYLVAIPKHMDGAIAAIRGEARFIVNFVGLEEAEAATKLRDTRNTFEEPFKATGLTRAEGVTVPCPRVKEAVGWAECELNSEMDVGDHLLFIGRVMHAELPQSTAERLFHVEGDKYTTTE